MAQSKTQDQQTHEQTRQQPGRHLGDPRKLYRLYRHPLPDVQSGRSPKYPFAHMGVGDCFYVPLETPETQHHLGTAARMWARRNSKEWKFATRIVGSRVGIWRVA